MTGECGRCLRAIDDTLDVTFQELYAYEDSTTDETTDEDEVGRMQGDLIDLEPALRDAVVLALPTNPLCREDCPGLCPECGVPWDDLPADHATSRSTRAGPRCDLETASCQGAVSRTRSRHRGRTQAQDVAQQHPLAPGAVEGHRGRDRGLPAVPFAEAAARGLHGLRHLQRSPGRRGLTSGRAGDDSLPGPHEPAASRRRRGAWHRADRR